MKWSLYHLIPWLGYHKIYQFLDFRNELKQMIPMTVLWFLVACFVVDLLWPLWSWNKLRTRKEAQTAHAGEIRAQEQHQQRLVCSHMSETSFQKSKILWFHHSVLALPRFQKSRQEWSNFKRQQKSIWNTSSSQRLSRSWRKETDFNIEPPFGQRLALKNDLMKYLCMNECQSERISQNIDIT